MRDFVRGLKEQDLIACMLQFEAQSTLAVTGIAQLVDLGAYQGLLVAWTIRVALLFMFATFALRLLEPHGVPQSGNVENEFSDSFDNAEKHAWLLGSFFLLLHAMATMLLVHRGSHLAAVEDTAQQTEALLGVAVGVGIYFNYVFVAVWLVDALWWIASSSSYRSRSRWWNRLIYGYLIFIAINGAIVFESGIVRWAALAGAVVLLGLMFRNNQRRIKQA